MIIFVVETKWFIACTLASYVITSMIVYRVDRVDRTEMPFVFMTPNAQKTMADNEIIYCDSKEFLLRVRACGCGNAIISTSEAV